MASRRRFITRQELPDELPPGAVSDPLFDIRGHTPGAGASFWPKLLQAMLAILLLIAIVGALLVIARAGARHSPALGQALRHALHAASLPPSGDWRR